MSTHVAINGQLIERDRGAVSVLDHGFTVGEGVFETCKVVNGKVFALTRHLHRLQRSAEIIGLLKPDVTEVRQQVTALLDADSHHLPALARLRITYTAGPGPLGSDRAKSTPTLVCVWEELSPAADTAALVTGPWPRALGQAATGAKTTSYIENVMALRFAKAHGGTEALLLTNRGQVCEGTGSNVFAVIAGQVITPPTSDGCLAGITRELILEWFAVTESSLTPTEVLSADEVFLSSTTRDIQAVRQLDAHHYRAPGPTTIKMQEEFTHRAMADIDP